MFNLKKHLINEIDKSGEESIIININNEISTNKVSFSLIGANSGDCIESFVNPFIFKEILDYLMFYNKFACFNVVNY